MGIRSRKNTVKGLQIIIVGCGKVGRTLVEQLSREGCGESADNQQSV